MNFQHRKTITLLDRLKKLESLSDLWAKVKKSLVILLIRKVQRLILHIEVKHFCGPKMVDYGPDEVVVVCVLRDAEAYIRSFIEHYFTLGVKHIFFLDNKSTDNTIHIIQSYKNVTILQTNLSFRKYAMPMRQYMIARFGKRSRWVLCVDHDELFDYPFSDVISLSTLLNYLNEHSYTTVVTHMLDMFSDTLPVNQNGKDEGTLKNLYKYYDVSDITEMEYFFPENTISNNEITLYFGGIRRMLFGVPGSMDLFLTKHPLLFLDGKIKPLYVDEHHVRYAHVADFNCILFHYRFHGDFYERTLRAVREKQYTEVNINEYKKYLSTLERNSHLQVKQETSQELKSVNDLVHNQFLLVSENYMSWVKQHA